ncbi:uncharacterized protein EI90DRAFT_3055605 [Cantharellus anzutake]|uniref:uncharacterized protein n=1 Tax=Cantharellus anzutake TaxID=1750568 RepID=UPI001905D3EA|nr:uncharacterized protein EI90DRAFT_3055605 [Cantharellus anzutake]KAF8331840.1 hypothetical protein EI90DRAFT_3055605 [Cantharellus anzutake]
MSGFNPKFKFSVAFSVLKGLEDFALECIVETLDKWYHRFYGPRLTPITIQAAGGLFSNHVILRFCDRDHLLMCLDCYTAGEMKCADSVYLVVSDKNLESVRKMLQKSHINRVLKGNHDKEPRYQGTRAWSEGKPECIDAGTYPPSDQTFLLEVRSFVRESYDALKDVLTFLPSLEPSTFRGSCYNPSHTLPFSTVTTTEIAQFVGEEIYDLLNGKARDCSPLTTDDNWRVDLTRPTLNIGLRILGVQPVYSDRLLGSIRAAKLIPPEHAPRVTSQPDFPAALCLLLAIAYPDYQQQVSIPRGRTSLRCSSAYLLTRLHPFFNPIPLRRYFRAHLEPGSVLMDPFSGTGSIPYQMIQLATQQSIGVIVICADIQWSNLEQIGRSTVLNEQIVQTERLQPVQWDSSGVGGGLRGSVVDGIVSDLPYGHRELSPSALRRLYPKFLAELGRVCRPGAFAVLCTAAAPLFRRCLSHQFIWQPLHLGWEHGCTEREFFINGMRTWVFLIERL